MNADAMPEAAYVHLSLENQAWLDSRTAWILREFGIKRIRGCPVALPSKALLHGRLAGDAGEVLAVFGDIAEAMGLDRRRIDFVLDENLAAESDSSALGTYQEIDGRFLIRIDAALLQEPQVCLGTLVHELCHVHLLGYGRLSGSEADHEPLTDLLAVYLGYGIVLANSVIYDRPIRAGHHYEDQVGRRGYLTMPMFGYSLALFSHLRKDDGAQWKRHMRLDVRDAFVKTMRHFERRGLPDLSRVPASFAAPVITREPDVDAEPAGKRPLPIYPSDVEVEIHEDETDFAAVAEPDASEDDDDYSCVYCSAASDGEESVPICSACRSSIDEGERETEAMQAMEERDQRFVRNFTLAAICVTAAFLGLFVLLSGS